MGGVDLAKLMEAHAILSQVVDSLVESDAEELDIEFEPLPDRVGIAALRPRPHSSSREAFTEGMNW